MSADEQKSLVRRYYEQIVNAGDVSRLAEFISHEYVEVHNNTRYPANHGTLALRVPAKWPLPYRSGLV